MTLRDRIAEVEERIARAAAQAGRRREEITLIAVTKVFPAELICQGYEAGLRDFGENYVQELEDKWPGVSALAGARFHLIGHLQSNKARRAVELFNAIQTVDSARLARRLDEAPPGRAGQRLGVMIEVKLSEEQTKAGAAPEALPALIDTIRACRRLDLAGLMTMPPWSDDAEVTRPYFRRLHELARNYGLAALSMGMSHDFEAAIQEGATHIRVGTALFGPRRKRA